jgi:hypothetical protein
MHALNRKSAGVDPGHRQPELPCARRHLAEEILLVAAAFLWLKRQLLNRLGGRRDEAEGRFLQRPRQRDLQPLPHATLRVTRDREEAFVSWSSARLDERDAVERQA